LWWSVLRCLPLSLRVLLLPELLEAQLWQASPGRLAVRERLVISGLQWRSPPGVADGRNRPDHQRLLWSELLMQQLSEVLLLYRLGLVESEGPEHGRLGADFWLRRGFPLRDERPGYRRFPVRKKAVVSMLVRN